jgi:hypothetical protein
MSPSKTPSEVCPEIPVTLTLRFYGYRTLRGPWIAVCIDLNLAVERPTWEEALKAIRQQVRGYINAVVAAEDKASISYLLPRPAPWKDHLIYRVACAVGFFRQLKKRLICLNETFFLPVPLPQCSPA